MHCLFPHTYLPSPYVIELLRYGILRMLQLSNAGFVLNASFPKLLPDVQHAVQGGDFISQSYGQFILSVLAQKIVELAELRTAGMWPALVVELAKSRHPEILARLGSWLRSLAKAKILSSEPEHLAVYKASCDKIEVEAAAREELLVHVSVLEALPGPWTQKVWEKIAKNMYIASKLQNKDHEHQ